MRRLDYGQSAQKMNNLYLLGGPPRTGKSIIMEKLLQTKPMALISTDAIQEGIRNMLTDNPFQMLRQIHIEGWAEQKPTMNGEPVKKPFSKQTHEHDLARQAIIGMLDHYGRNLCDVAVEGSIITPDWVQSLRLDSFTIRAAFVGYLDEGHADTAIKYAEQNEADWLNEWLKNENGDETSLRKWFSDQVDANTETAKQAHKYGYKYFDISAQTFHSYSKVVQSYLLDRG